MPALTWARVPKMTPASVAEYGVLKRLSYSDSIDVASRRPFARAIFVKLCDVRFNKDWLKAYDSINSLKSPDLIKMREEHRMTEINQINGYFEEVGILLQMKLIDINFVEKLLHGHVIRTWEKMRPLIEEVRKHYNDPQVLEGFEYL